MIDPISIWFSYKFIQLLSTPWNKTKAFKLGIIDKNGVILRKRSTLTTSEERAACTKMHIVAWNLKRILDKFPPTQTHMGSFAAALYLLKEDFPKVDINHLSQKLLKEDDTASSFAINTMPEFSGTKNAAIGRGVQRLGTLDSIQAISKSFGLDPEKAKKDLETYTKEYLEAGMDEKTSERMAKARIMQKHKATKRISEDAVVNNVGSGNIAGTTPSTVAGPTSFFGGCPVFRVSADEFHRCKAGKPKYHKYSKYLNVKEGCGKTIHDYAKKNRSGAIILQHEADGSMIYLRKGKNHA